MFGGLGFGFSPVQRGYSKHVDKMFDVGFYEGGPHPTTPGLRLKDQELDGIDAEVMYGILGVGMRLENPELIRVVYQIYNDWAADFCRTNPHRFVGLACLPNHDPAAAAAELRRAARLGLKGADFPVSTAVYPIWHGAWDPLWAAAQECQIPISFHMIVLTAASATSNRTSSPVMMAIAGRIKATAPFSRVGPADVSPWTSRSLSRTAAPS